MRACAKAWLVLVADAGMRISCFCSFLNAEIIRQKQPFWCLLRQRKIFSVEYLSTLPSKLQPLRRRKLRMETAISYRVSQSTQPLSLSVSPASRAKASASALAASEKNFLGRVLKYTPCENFYLPCKRRKILFFRILPALASVFRFAPDGIWKGHHR